MIKYTKLDLFHKNNLKTLLIGYNPYICINSNYSIFQIQIAISLNSKKLMHEYFFI